MKRIHLPTIGGSDWQHLLAKPDLRDDKMVAHSNSGDGYVN